MIATPIPKTKASEILDDLTHKCLEQRLLTPFETGQFDRIIEKSIKADPEKGWVSKTLLSALSGKADEFKTNLDKLRRMSPSDQIRTFFFPHALALSQYDYAASMAKELNLESTGLLDQKLEILRFLFDLENLRILLERSAKLHGKHASGTDMFISTASTKSTLKWLGIGKNDLAMLSDVSAEAIRALGYYALSKPIFTYDPEEYLMFLSFELPVSIETAIEIEEKFYELADEKNGLPIDKVVFTVQAGETTNAM